MGGGELLNKFFQVDDVRLHQRRIEYLVHMKPNVLRPSILDEILIWTCHESSGY
jgi:hypothetical protein